LTTTGTSATSQATSALSPASSAEPTNNRLVTRQKGDTNA
jgi:hypothetical protein